MSFTLHFKGGPLDSSRKSSLSAPQTIALDAEQAGGVPGIYSLYRICGVKAYMAWHPREVAGSPAEGK